ncbi:uncharacterized protein LOC111129585 isoform X5 [Crassostrea virginica]
MLKIALLCTLFIVCMQDEPKGNSLFRQKRQVSTPVPPGTVIRRTNVPDHEACEKLCKEEKLIKCLFIKYLKEKKLCYLSDSDPEKVSVAIPATNTTGPDVKKPAPTDSKDISKLLSLYLEKLKSSPQKGKSATEHMTKTKPKTAKKTQIIIKQYPGSKTSKGPRRKDKDKSDLAKKLEIEAAKKLKEDMNKRLNDVDKFMEMVHAMKNKIHILNNGISSNFSKIREIQIRSLLHFNKRLHDLYQDLKKTKQDIDGLRTVTKDLKASNSATSSNVEDRIANLQRSKKNFDVAIRVLWKKIGNLHHDMTLFRRITTAIEANMNSIRKKQLNTLEMKRFENVVTETMKNYNFYKRRMWRKMRILEQNIRLVARAVVLSQAEETNSRVLIQRISKELQALKKAVKDSYIWHNVKQLGGFHIPGQNISIDDHRGHLETYLKVLNKVNNEKFLMMSQRINELLLKTLQSISKLERERKSSAQSKVEALKNILRTSLVSLYTWTRNVKKSVKQLDEKINDLTQKTQRITYGRKTAELKTHQIEERLKEIKKEENTLAETLKELEKSNYENSVKLHNDLQNELKQTINKKNSKLQKNTDRKIQNAITAATRVDQKLKKMKQTTDKKLKDAKGKIENKVKAAFRKVSEKVAKDQKISTENAVMQRQKNDMKKALEKLSALGKLQYLKLKENVETIMNAKTGNVDNLLSRKMLKIKDAVRKTLHSVSSAEKKDHKQVAKLRKQFGDFLKEVQNIEEQRKRDDRTKAKIAEQKRDKKLQKALVATAKKVTEMQQNLEEKNQREKAKLKKEMKKGIKQAEKLKEDLSKTEENLLHKEAKAKADIIRVIQSLKGRKQKTRQEKERLLKFKNKLDALKQKVKDKDRAIQQKEKAAKKMKIKHDMEKLAKYKDKLKKKEEKLIDKENKEKESIIKVIQSLEGSKQKTRDEQEKLSRYKEKLKELKQKMQDRDRATKQKERESEKMIVKMKTKMGKVAEYKNRMKKKEDRLIKLEHKEKEKIARAMANLKDNKLKTRQQQEHLQKLERKFKNLKQKVRNKNKTTKEKVEETEKMKRKQQEKLRILKTTLKTLKQRVQDKNRVAKQRKKDLEELKKRQQEKSKNLKTTLKTLKQKVQGKIKVVKEKERELEKKRRRQQEKSKELKKTLKVLKQRMKDTNKVAKLKEKGLKKLKSKQQEKSRNLKTTIKTLKQRVKEKIKVARQKEKDLERMKSRQQGKSRKLKKTLKALRQTVQDKNRLAKLKEKTLRKMIKMAGKDKEEVAKYRAELKKKEKKLQEKEREAKIKISKIVQSLKERQEVIKAEKKKQTLRHKMKVVPKTRKHEKIPSDAIKIPFPKATERWKEQLWTRQHKPGIMKIFPKIGRYKYLSRGGLKIPFTKRMQILHELEKSRREFKQAKLNNTQMKLKLREKRKEKKELSLEHPKTTKEKKMIDRRKKILNRKIKKIIRICYVSREEMRRWQARRKKVQEKLRLHYHRITEHWKEQLRKRQHKPGIMKIFPKIGRYKYLSRGGFKIPFTKRIEILRELEKSRREFKQAKLKNTQMKLKLREKRKEKKELSLEHPKTTKEKKMIDRRKKILDRKIKKIIRICYVSREEMRRWQARRKKVQEKLRLHYQRITEHWKEQLRTRQHKPGIMKIFPKIGRYKYLSRGGFKIPFTKRMQILRELEKSRREFKQAKLKNTQMKLKLREKRKEKKELSLEHPKTTKEKKMIDRRKKILNRKIKKIIRICYVSREEMRRWQARRRKVQEKLRLHYQRITENKDEITREGQQKHFIMKIIPQAGRHDLYLNKGAVRIPFTKRAKLLDELKKSTREYNLAKLKKNQMMDKLRQEIEERKGLSLVHPKSTKEKKMIENRKKILDRKIKRRKMICFVSVKELRRRQARRKKLQEEYRRQKVARHMEEQMQKKQHKPSAMNIIPETRRHKLYLSKGAVRIPFTRKMKLLNELKKSTREYNLAKLKKNQMMDKLKEKIEEKKELSLVHPKSTKEKKMIDKQKKILDRKIKRRKMICFVSAKVLKRMRARRRKLIEKYRRQQVTRHLGEQAKKRQHKPSAMKIIPKTGRHKHLYSGAFKIPFSKKTKILDDLKKSTRKYNKTKMKKIQMTEKLRTKIKEKKSLTLIKPTTEKEKKLVNKRKKMLNRKIKKIIKICRITRKELERQRTRRKKLQEILRREKIKEKEMTQTQKRKLEPERQITYTKASPGEKFMKSKKRAMKIVSSGEANRILPKGANKITLFSKES